MGSLTLAFPDGSKRTYPQGITALQIAADLGKKLEKDAVAVKLGGVLTDLTASITTDSSISIVIIQSPEGLEVLRHSTAHLLAHAVKEMWPKAQITIGPVIENGFYYDIDFPEPVDPEILPKIEEKMREISARKLNIVRKELPRDEAIEFFRNQNEQFKVKIIEELTENTVSLYEQGNFTDLCRGPHLPNTERIPKFKLLSLAGAYWRGNENNPMLTRIYGTAWPSQKELDSYIQAIEEAKKRDHRKLGPELGLFTFLPVAPAMPFYLPKGTILYNKLVDYMRKETALLGYQEVICPQLMTNSLWERSGHLDHHQHDMFMVEQKEGPSYCLKPMNCPGHASLYASSHHSYRELPLRFSEFSRLHRNERAGVSHGVFRARAFAQDDGHIFCTDEQIGSEALSLIQFTFRIYRLFGFEKVSIRLATKPEKSLGTAESWEKATEALEASLKMAGLEYKIAHGEGAFYGPKIEFHIQDSLGRSWQCGTIQVDYSMPERFALGFTDKDNVSRRPVMIHRAILGSLERFLGILIEHHAGHLPFWISPVQVVILNVSAEHAQYAKTIANELKCWGIRVELDLRNEKLGYKIRQAQLQKIPLMLILGKNEVDKHTVSVRKCSGEMLNDLTLLKLKDFIEPQLKLQEV